MSESPDLNLREVIAHIDLMQADARKRETVAPWQIVTVAVAFAACFAAGSLTMALLLH
jgi:hypothetical protein